MTAHSPMASAAVRRADLADPAECARIDAFVAEHPDSESFHRPQWSLAVEEGCGQRGHYLLAERPGRGLVGCLSLTHVRSVLFGHALVSTGFGTGGGILALDSAAAEVLLRAAEQLADRLGCATLELRGGPIPDSYRIRDDQYVGFVMPLPQGEEAILKSIRRRHRGVKRARALGLHARVGRGAREQADFVRVFGESMRNLGSPVFPPRLFAAMLDRFGEDCDIITIFDGTEPVAGLLNFYFKGTILPFWGGGTMAGRSRRANELLYFEAMCHGSRRGCTRFDFGRSKVGSGNHSFKAGWGIEPQPLRYGTRTAPGASPRDVNPLSPKYRLQVAAWKKLPLPLANLIGPPIARGLG
jgi:FemAB-related protein (PEP-CTERM system-associated)